MKLWTVTIETTIPVVAETRRWAVRAASDAFDNMSPGELVTVVNRVEPGTKVVCDYNPGDLLYGVDYDLTLADAEDANNKGTL